MIDLEAAKKLLAGIVFDKTKTIKKDEIDSRPTNIKVITSYFKDKFRNELASKGMTSSITHYLTNNQHTFRIKKTNWLVTDCGNNCFKINKNKLLNNGTACQNL